MATTTTTAPTLTIADMAKLAMAYHGLDWYRTDAMLADPEGSAILALLVNAAAKESPTLYQIKSPLIRWAITLASDWWAAPHTGYGDNYETDTVVYIQHTEQFSFHVRSSDEHLADLLADPPRSERGWSGKPLQPIARQLAEEWLKNH